MITITITMIIAIIFDIIITMITIIIYPSASLLKNIQEAEVAFQNVWTIKPLIGISKIGPPL